MSSLRGGLLDGLRGATASQRQRCASARVALLPDAKPAGHLGRVRLAHGERAELADAGGDLVASACRTRRDDVDCAYRVR